jgi:glycosyltransferase involved in cell wall biosynthesis
MTHALVTTIIPVYNRPAHLKEAVASVLEQDYRPVEIVIVDDASTDGSTLRTARALAALHPEIAVIESPSNQGPGAAREIGRRHARGEFIQYLDSDDLLLPGKFADQVRALEEDPQAGICYGLSLAWDERSNATHVTHRTDEVHTAIFPAVLQARIWPTVSPLYRRSVCDNIGPWSSQRVLEDWDYELRAGRLALKLQYCDQPVALVRYHRGNHAGLAWQNDPAAMRARIETYVRAVEHAVALGLDRSQPEVRHLVRSVFWMSREAAAYGLTPEAQLLFGHARELAVDPGWDYTGFRIAASLIGWKQAGLLTRWLLARNQVPAAS